MAGENIVTIWKIVDILLQKFIWIACKWIGKKVWAQLKVEKGPSYKIDSIRVLGDVKIDNNFLQRYLDIKNGSLFNREKLLGVSRRMRELTYVEEEYPAKLVCWARGLFLKCI
jgi:hypothetical protein